MDELLTRFQAEAATIAEECDQGKEDRLKAAWADLYPEYKRLSQPVRCKVCPGRTAAYDDGLVVGTRLVLQQIRSFANKHPDLCSKARTLILDHLSKIPTPRTSQSRERRDDGLLAIAGDVRATAEGLYTRGEDLQQALMAAKALPDPFIQLEADRQVLLQELEALADRLPPKIGKLCKELRALANEVG